MNSGIKIIKRIRTDELQNSPLRQVEKTPRQIEREMAGKRGCFLDGHRERFLAEHVDASGKRKTRIRHVNVVRGDDADRIRPLPLDELRAGRINPRHAEFLGQS